jgi:hypothetical protein
MSCARVPPIAAAPAKNLATCDPVGCNPVGVGCSFPVPRRERLMPRNVERSGVRVVRCDATCFAHSFA